MMTEDYIFVAALASILFYLCVRLRFELQMLQQNSYRLPRYFRWLRGDTLNVSRITDLLLALILAGFTGGRWGVYAVGAVGLLSLYKGVRLLLTKYKKPLVFTARAVRLYLMGTVLALGASAVWYLWGMGAAVLAAMVCGVLSPAVISLAVMILMPLEWAVRRWYLNDARRILASMPNLKIIGITGSYGKTSTKHYLYRILSERFNVVMTPGSFNTTLGVVRTIREHLRPFTEVFIVEMGAKQRGDIAEICDLVHPSIGIITAVGEQHLESFRTIKNVQRTKFELVDALPADGVAILNDDFEYIASRPVENVGKVLRYTSKNFSTAPFQTRLLGRYNMSNLYAAWLCGRELGMTDEQMRYAISGIEPVSHRLEVKRTPGGLTIIDDAFNSNPHGAEMALEVLSSFTGGQRIIVTPGMIELGAKQEEYNRRFGRQMGRVCDFAIIVGEYNREALMEGFAEGNSEFAKDDPAAAAHTAICVPTFDDASRKVGDIARAGDVILYENDLPDTFK